MNNRVTPRQIALSFSVIVVTASAAISAQLDSSAFSHQYNGDVLPNAAGYSHAGPFAAGPSSDGDIMSFRNSSNDSGYFQNNQFSGAVSNATGWTAEWRFKLNEDFSEASAGTLNFFVADTMVYRIFRLGKQRFYSTLTGSSDGEFSNASNTDGFHTFRLAREPGSADWKVWRDGVQVGAPIGGGAFAGADLWWGSGSSGVWGPTVNVDYFRFDNTGAYDPVPEPSTCVLLAFIGLAWRAARVRI